MANNQNSILETASSNQGSMLGAASNNQDSMLGAASNNQGLILEAASNNQGSMLGAARADGTVTAISSTPVGVKLSMVNYGEYEAVTAISLDAINKDDGSVNKNKDSYQFVDDDEDEENAISLEEDPTQMISLRQRIPWEKKDSCHRLVHLSHVLSLSNALMFPHLCSRYGGAAFLTAYLCAYFFVGVPILCVEMGLGQFSSLPPVELFRKMSPSLAGIGVAMLMILTIRSIFLSAIASQSILAGILTIMEGLKGGGPSWNNCKFNGAYSKLCFKYEYEECYDQLAKNGRSSTQQDATIFEENGICKGWVDGMTLMYKLNKSFHVDNRWHYWRPPHLDYMSANVYKPIYRQNQWKFPYYATIVLFFVWSVTALFCYIGVRKLGKAFVYLKMVLLFGFLVNLALSIFYLTDAIDFLTFFNPDFSALGNLEIWADAVSHVINSLNLGSGAVHRISSFSQFNENFLINASFTSGVDILFSLIIGLVFITSASSVAHRIFPGDQTYHRLKFIFTHGFITTHTMFPEHIVWSWPNFGWIFAAIHYFKIGILGIPTIVVAISIVRLAFEEMAVRSKKMRKWTMDEKKLMAISTGILVLFCFLASIIMIGPSGFILVKLWHEFSGVSVVFICLCEVVSMCLHYSFRRYLANVQTMLHRTGQRIHMCCAFSVIWYYIFTPILLTVALCFKIFHNRLTRVLEYIFPMSLEFYGWSLVICITILIIFPLLRYVIIFGRRTHGILHHIFEPLPNWGPIDKDNYSRNMKNERTARVPVPSI